MEDSAHEKIKALEQEIIHMQSHMAHQESLIQSLNEVVIEQQRRLDALQKDQHIIKEHLRYLQAPQGDFNGMPKR